MAFIKRGDAQPILKTHGADANQDDEETKKALEEAKQATKNINEDSNNLELNKKSVE